MLHLFIILTPILGSFNIALEVVLAVILWKLVKARRRKNQILEGFIDAYAETMTLMDAAAKVARDLKKDETK